MLVPGATKIFVAMVIVIHLARGSPLLPPLGQGLVLNEFIRHFEPAVYDRDALLTQQKRLRRDVTSPAPPVRLQVKANSRVFRLLLKPDHSVFSPDVVFEGTSGREINFHPSTLYSGTLEDDDQAEVHGLVTEDGLFDGTISTRLEDFYIEPVSRYLKQNTSSPRFHSIVYRTSDVYSPQSGQPCASQRLYEAIKETQERKNNYLDFKTNSFHQNGKNQDYEIDESNRANNVKFGSELPVVREYRKKLNYKLNKEYNEKDKSRGSKSTSDVRINNDVGEVREDSELNKEFNDEDEFFWDDSESNSEKVIDNSRIHGSGLDSVNRSHRKNRSKRWSDDYVPEPLDISSYFGSFEDTARRNTSRLDTYYYNPSLSYEFPNISDGFNVRHVHKRATIDPKKTTCMLYLQADHLFYQKYGTEEACIEVMTRHVQRVNSIYKSTDFNQDGKPDNISFMIKRIKVHTLDALKDPSYRFPLNYGVEKFLELFSEEDYDQFCLAYMFTYRDFEMGTLGLAWTGDLKNAGGVCEKNGHYRGSMKSLNTGIVTLLNYGKHVPPAVSHVTLAHEIGHNFGSPHDPELCTPGGEDGNFIMFARATSGDKKNNNKFSPCSLNSINPVLNTKARSPKGCFTEPQAAICGNGVVEVGEECDCGWEEDCRDDCCFPQRRYPPTEEPPCKLTPRSTCSPSQGPCCTSTCELKFGDKCRDDNGCRDASFCDGRGPQCPPSINKPNKTICNEELVCFMGECTGSICLAFGLESCQCIPGPHDSKTKACELCCKLPGDDQPCRSSFDWNIPPYDMPDLFSKPGTPCNDYNGYCDVFQKCREVDPSGPLATLRKLLLSDESIASFKRWVTDHWYAVLLIVFAVLFILVVSTKLLGKRPNLKLKNVTIIHSSTTETVRLPPEGEGGQVTIHPAAVRSKLPLKRKVREKQRMHRHRMKVKDAANNNNNNNNNNATPKKVVNKKKKKKKPGPPAAEDDVTKHSGEAAEEAALQRKQKKAKQQTKVKKKKKKEVIDYSAVQSEKDKLGLVLGLPDKNPLPENDPVGKVKNWLLTSQHPVDSSLIPKSKSTPIGLTGSAESPVKTRTSAIVHHSRAEKPKSRSTGNLQGANKNGEKEKLRLQVVYKPPFKFSLKLRKAEKGAGTTSSVVVVERNHRRSVPADRKRGGPRNAVLLKTRDHKRSGNNRKARTKDSALAPVSPAVASAPNLQLPATGGNQNKDHEVDIDSNIQTVPSDLEVLLSESEFLFSDA